MTIFFVQSRRIALQAAPVSANHPHGQRQLSAFAGKRLQACCGHDTTKASRKPKPMAAQYHQSSFFRSNATRIPAKNPKSGIMNITNASGASTSHCSRTYVPAKQIASRNARPIHSSLFFACFVSFIGFTPSHDFSMLSLDRYKRNANQVSSRFPCSHCPFLCIT